MEKLAVPRVVVMKRQPDSDARSTGNGSFDYGEWDGATFDGPPHDREYFELHMTALNNYFSSMSYGALEIEFDVAPAAAESAWKGTRPAAPPSAST